MTDFAQRLEQNAVRQEPRTLARTLWLQGHLAVFLQACAVAGLECIVLKGAALTETAYPRLGLRDFRDLDILVRPADAPRARAVLDQLGYQADESHWQDLLSGHDGQADFALPTPAGPVILELHTNFVNNDLLQDQVSAMGEGIWQRARSVTLAGAPARVLGPEDQLLHLCLHLAGHYLVAPRSLWDIERVCAVQTVDWPLLVELARRERLTRIAYASLWLAARLMDAAVPHDALAALAPRFPRLLERLAFARARSVTEDDAMRGRLPLLLLLADRPLHLPRLFLRLLFPSRRWLRDHYAPLWPAAPVPALYLAHLRSLLRGGRPVT